MKLHIIDLLYRFIYRIIFQVLESMWLRTQKNPKLNTKIDTFNWCVNMDSIHVPKHLLVMVNYICKYLLYTLTFAQTPTFTLTPTHAYFTVNRRQSNFDYLYYLIVVSLGSVLPRKFEPFPENMYGRPLEEIDTFIYEEVCSFLIFSNTLNKHIET